MPAFLELIINDAPTRQPLGAVETLGRDRSNTIQLHDASVSRNHAVIRRVGNEQYYVLDLGSRNGSFINEQRVMTPTLLRDGDTVLIGESPVKFFQDTSEESTVLETEQSDLGDTISLVRSNIRSVTILVADIRGYTSMSERIEITVLSKLMSKWFYEVQNIIEQNFGRVDKFIGDCVMALWEASENPQDMVLNCLRAAWHIHSLTLELGVASPQINEELKIGAGINTGVAALGIGSDNTAMGDTVNLAFRLEEATKTLGREIVVSQSAHNLLPASFWDGREQEIYVKGKAAPIMVCGLSFAELKSFLESSSH